MCQLEKYAQNKVIYNLRRNIETVEQNSLWRALRIRGFFEENVDKNECGRKKTCDKSIFSSLWRSRKKGQLTGRDGKNTKVIRILCVLFTFSLYNSLLETQKKIN